MLEDVGGAAPGGAPNPGIPTLSALVPGYTTANVFVGADGVLVVQFIQPSTGEIIKVELGPGGGYSLLKVRDQTWQEASIQFTADPHGRGPAVAVRTARTQDDGSIKATATTSSMSGQRLHRSMRIQADGGWDSTYDFARPSGARVTGNASSAGGPDATVSLLREKYNGLGKKLWSVTTEARPVTAQANKQRVGSANNVHSAMLSVSQATYADGTLGNFSLLSYETERGRTTDGSGTWGWKPAPAPAGATTWVRTDATETTDTTTEMTRFKDGSVRVESVTRIWDWDTGGKIVDITGVEITGSWRYADGTSSSWSRTIGGGNVTDRPDIDRGPGAAGPIHTETWESTYTDRHGVTTHARGSVSQSDAGESRTTSTRQADGTTVVETTTTDKQGHGTRHTTVVDRNGNPVPGSDRTEDVGPPGGGSSGHGSSSGGATGGGSTPPPSSDGNNDPDDGGDDGAPLGEEGGPSGMGWDGGAEGPAGLLPTKSGRIYGSTVTIVDPLSDPDHDRYRSVPARMASGLTYDALVNPGVAYGGRGSELRVSNGSGSPTPQVAVKGTTILGVAPVPPEEEFAWENPEVHYAYVRQVISALKDANAVDPQALRIAEASATTFGEFAASITSVNRSSTG